MSITALEQKLAPLFGYDHAVLTGRARSGLVAIIEILRDKSKAPIAVLLPENICSVLAIAIRAAGGIAVTVAVSPATGLPEDQAFVQAMKRIERPGIVMPAHLYGFVGTYPETIKYASENSWFIAENDTNAVRMSSAPFGDALLVSFGYAKPIALGSSGAVLTNDSALAHMIRTRVSGYALLDSTTLMQEQQCMLRRRAIRATLDCGSAELSRICDVETGLTRFRFDDREGDRLSVALDQFPEECARRIGQCHLWDRALASLDDILHPVALPQPVPWRLIRKIPQKRNNFAQSLWECGIDAGINYRSLWRELPPDYLTGERSRSDPWGEGVLNLWLSGDYDTVRIEEAAHILRESANDL